MFGWGVKTVTVDQLRDKLQHGKTVLIDVREPYEFATGRVKGAVNIPLGRLADEVGKFDPRAETYVICQSGHRSATAVRQLERAGFDQAFSVKGGTSAWRGPLVR
jgi:rhodanese-related sulfurtransferase